MEATLRCVRCGISNEERRLMKCSICYKMFCDECAAILSGRRFCSQFCAEYFFHGGEEDL